MGSATRERMERSIHSRLGSRCHNASGVKFVVKLVQNMLAIEGRSVGCDVGRVCA